MRGGDEWRGTKFKEREVRNAIARVIRDEFGYDTIDIDKIFNIAESQAEY